MRKPGYYWVKLSGKWRIAKYFEPNKTNNGYWKGAENELTFGDAFFDEINENIIQDKVFQIKSNGIAYFKII